MKQILENIKLYLVLETDYLQIPLRNFLEEVIQGGAKTIQLRNKFQNIEEKLEYAYIVREITHKCNALFIMNDSIEIAVASNADGVHIGASDGDISIIKTMSSNMIIGYSCNNMEDVFVANQYADYAGIGPYTNTITKKDHRHILGKNGIYELNNSLNIPSVAIGGINISNIAEVLKAGTYGLAISSFLCKSKKPYDDAKRLLDIINERV